MFVRTRSGAFCFHGTVRLGSLRCRTLSRTSLPTYRAAGRSTEDPLMLRLILAVAFVMFGGFTSTSCSTQGAVCADRQVSCDRDGSGDTDATGPGVITAEPTDEAAYLFDPTAVRTYNLIVAEADLAVIDANPAAEQWVTGMLEFEGKRHGPLGVRYKGSVGAFAPPCMGGFVGAPQGPKQGKCSVKIGFDHVDEAARFFGLKKLNFHSMNRDSSMLRDRLGYSMFREMGLAAPRAVHARLLFNGRLEGLFALVEQVDGRFTRTRFGEGGKGNLYKEIWPIHGAAEPYVAALETNQSPATSVERMLAFKRAIDAEPPAVVNCLDRDYMLRYIAVDRVIVNDDGAFHWWCGRLGQGNNPNGVGNHNYYWYEAAEAQRFWLIPWDLDSSFEGSSFVHIAPEWTKEGSCTCDGQGGWGQLAPSCDRLIDHWATWRAEYETAVDAFLKGAFAPNKIDKKLADWTSQIESHVRESAGLNGAPPLATWEAAVNDLRNKIATFRSARGYPY
jgi:hypothetical protein